MIIRVTTFAVAVVVMSGALGAQSQSGRAGAPPANQRLEISAIALSMGTVAPGANAVVQMNVDRWTTPEERAHLIETMLTKGPDALLSALQRMPSHGRFRIPGLVGDDPHQLRLGRDIYYAWQTVQDNGMRRIVLATDRYIGVREANLDPRTTDYPFTFMELRVNANGTGEGALAVATSLNFNKSANTLTMENYGSEPVRLNQVTVKVRQ